MGTVERNREARKQDCLKVTGLAPVAQACNPSYWEAEIRRIDVGDQSRQIIPGIPISKISRAQWTGGVAQEIERLLCMREALSSDSSPTSTNKISDFFRGWGFS
jgi:hypothetical protein